MQVTKKRGDKRIEGGITPPERIEIMTGPNVGRDYEEAVESIYGQPDCAEEETTQEEEEKEEEKEDG